MTHHRIGDIIHNVRREKKQSPPEKKGRKEIKKYQVIGGQYESHWYGESDSLRGAKIYPADCVREVESKGRITSPDGVMIRIPVGDPI